MARLADLPLAVDMFHTLAAGRPRSAAGGCRACFPAGLSPTCSRSRSGKEPVGVVGYGLAAYANTRLANTQAIAALIETGMISINHHGHALPEAPFGGVKDRGCGSEGGSEAIEAYLNTKFVTEARL